MLHKDNNYVVFEKSIMPIDNKKLQTNSAKIRSRQNIYIAWNNKVSLFPK